MSTTRQANFFLSVLGGAALLAAGNAMAGSVVLVCEPAPGGAFCDLFVSGGTVQSTQWLGSGGAFVLNSTDFYAQVGCSANPRSPRMTANVTFTDGSQDSDTALIRCEF